MSLVTARKKFGQEPAVVIDQLRLVHDLEEESRDKRVVRGRANSIALYRIEDVAERRLRVPDLDARVGRAGARDHADFRDSHGRVATILSQGLRARERDRALHHALQRRIRALRRVAPP